MIFICLLLALFGFSVWLTSDGVLRKFGRDLKVLFLERSSRAQL